MGPRINAHRHLMRRKRHSRKAQFRLGFVALADCASLTIAPELGIFVQHGSESICPAASRFEEAT